MDTRDKILPFEGLSELLESGDWEIALGLFDPLTALQASRLAGIAAKAQNGRARKLLVVVLEDKDALLSADARAALIAALRQVDFVAIAEPEGWKIAIPKSAHVHIVEDAEGEKRRSADFVQFVLNRQSNVVS